MSTLEKHQLTTTSSVQAMFVACRHLQAAHCCLMRLKLDEATSNQTQLELIYLRSPSPIQRPRRIAITYPIQRIFEGHLVWTVDTLDIPLHLVGAHRAADVDLPPAFPGPHNCKIEFFGVLVLFFNVF